MTTALQSAEQHLAELSANRIAARDKPSAFHHGLITTLVAELKAASVNLGDLKALALDWYHGESCDGYGSDEEAEWPECNCGVGDVLRATIAGCKVYVERDEKRYGLSRIVGGT